MLDFSMTLDLRLSYAFGDQHELAKIPTATLRPATLFPEGEVVPALRCSLYVFVDSQPNALLDRNRGWGGGVRGVGGSSSRIRARSHGPHRAYMVPDHYRGAGLAIWRRGRHRRHAAGSAGVRNLPLRTDRQPLRRQRCRAPATFLDAAGRHSQLVFAGAAGDSGAEQKSAVALVTCNSGWCLVMT